LGMVDVIGFTTCLFFFLHNNVDLPWNQKIIYT
jgi:hypothetical protein